MKQIFLLLISAIILFAPEPNYAQEKQIISGTVFIPAVSNKKRTFRGRLYRNRLSSRQKKHTIAKKVQSSFSDVIVMAIPISYVYKVDSLPPVNVLQINAEFVPRVIPVTPGTEIRFINRDKFFHNVFSITPGSKFNIGRKPTGVIEQRKVEQLGEIKLFCDIHAQMNATILCINTPYFTRAGANGRYSLSELPQGTYELKVYHPDLPNISEIINITAGQKIIKNFTLSR
jgi:plastocyanin